MFSFWRLPWDKGHGLRVRAMLLMHVGRCIMLPMCSSPPYARYESVDWRVGAPHSHSYATHTHMHPCSDTCPNEGVRLRCRGTHKAGGSIPCRGQGQPGNRGAARGLPANPGHKKGKPEPAFSGVCQRWRRSSSACRPAEMHAHFEEEWNRGCKKPCSACRPPKQLCGLCGYQHVVGARSPLNSALMSHAPAFGDI